MPKQDEIIFELKQIGLSFGSQTIFNNLNLSIATGEKLLLSTPSGSGKTSFLKLLLGFTFPEQGEILFRTKQINSSNIKKVRSEIAYLSQDVDFPNGKVKKVIDEILSYTSNKDLKVEESAIKKQLQFLALDPKILAKNVNELSGGERQRLGWVLLFLLDKPIWLLDEPTSALDKDLKTKLIDKCIKCNKTIVVISHDTDWQKQELKHIKNF